MPPALSPKTVTVLLEFSAVMPCAADKYLAIGFVYRSHMHQNRAGVIDFRLDCTILVRLFFDR
ncbi:MAG: hypothetical protein CMP85_05195 [Gammaproteobacteria bacterium]|nr:hypothetical protein [Gammaproteobacteria bacterium]